MPVILPRVTVDVLPPDPPVSPVARRNLAHRPQPSSTGAVPGGVVDVYPSGQAGTTTLVTGATDGPTVPETGQLLDRYIQRTITTPAGSATVATGFRSITVSRRTPVDIPAGSDIHLSLYGLCNNASTVAFTARFTLYDGATAYPDTPEVTQNLGGVVPSWRRFETVARAPGPVTAIGYDLLSYLPAIQAGRRLAMTGVMIATAGGYYHDGATPPHTLAGIEWEASWDGAAYESPSTLTPVLPPPALAEPLLPVRVDLALDRRWSPYAQATVEVAGNHAARLNPARSDPPRLLITQSVEVRRSDTLADLTADLAGQTLADLTTAWDGLTLGDITHRYSDTYNGPGVADAPARGFDLGIRSATYSTATRSTTIVAASDEALAQDYRLVDTAPVELVGPPHFSDSVVAIVQQALALAGMVFAGIYRPSGRPTTGGGSPALTSPTDAVWEPGTSLWDYLSQVLTPVGYRVWCDERRQWAADSISAPHRPVATHTIVPTISTVGRTRDTDWYDAVVARFEWTDPVTGAQRWAYRSAQADPARPPTRVRYVTRKGPPSESWLRRTLDSVLTAEAWATIELEAPPVVGITPGDIIDTGDAAYECLAVQWTYPDNTMRVKA